MGADGKVRLPTQAGGRGRGCGYNFRPQACSRLRRRLGSTRQDRCRRPTENLQCITQMVINAECLRPRSSTSRPPPLFGKLGAGFVYSVHAPPAWPIRGERRRTSLIQRANRRSPCCSAAKACAGEVGQWLGRARADEAAGGLGCSRWRCSVLPARPDPSSLGRLEGTRARSASWGLELQGLDEAGRGSPTLRECESAGIRAPPSAGATVAEAPENALQARRTVLRGRLVPCSQAAVRSGARARAPCGGPLDPARRGPGQVSLPASPGPLATLGPICLFPRVLPGLAE